MCVFGVFDDLCGLVGFIGLCLKCVVQFVQFGGGYVDGLYGLMFLEIDGGGFGFLDVGIFDVWQIGQGVVFVVKGYVIFGFGYYGGFVGDGIVYYVEVVFGVDDEGEEVVQIVQCVFQCLIQIGFCGQMG